MCSVVAQADSNQTWVEERCVPHYSIPPIEDEGICVVAHLLDSLLGNPAQVSVPVAAWRYALAIVYVTIEGISASVPIPLTFQSYECTQTRNESKSIQEQSDIVI